MFLPWLYSSQPYEQLFRATRPLKSTFNTAVNFSIKELMNRVKRVEMLNSIYNDLGNTENGEENCFTFLQSNKQVSASISSSYVNYFPSLDLKTIIINNALNDCWTLLNILGIMTTDDS